MVGGLVAGVAAAFAVDKLFGKGKPPKPKEMDRVPDFKDISEVFNKIAGVATKKNKDGTLSIYRLPRSAEDQRIYDDGLKLIQSSMNNLMYLSKNYPDVIPDIIPAMTVLADASMAKKDELAHVLNAPDFSKFVDDYKASQTQAINKYYDTAGAGAVENLRSLGYSVDSTASRDIQSRYDNARGEALTQLDAEAPRYAMDLYTQNQTNVLNRANSVFNMNNSLSETALAQNNLENQQFNMQQDTNDRQFNQQMQLGQLGNNVRMYDKDTAINAGNNAIQQGLMVSNAQNVHNREATQINNQGIASYNDSNLKRYMATPDSLVYQMGQAFVGGLGKSKAFSDGINSTFTKLGLE